MQPIEIILFRGSRGVLSLVGAGGKTSLMFHLARQLSRSGQRVLTTTTTKILVPTPEQSRTVIVADDPDVVLLQASRLFQGGFHISAATRQLDNGKLQGFTSEEIGLFHESGLFDWVLVEADGAARCTLKAPAEHEPVIPAVTTVLVAVAGLDGVGEPLSEATVFRSALAGRLMGIGNGEVISESALARLFVHHDGLLKGAPSQARRFIFLNKADTPSLRECGERVARNLQEMCQEVADAVIVGQALDSVLVHAVYPLTVAV